MLRRSFPNRFQIFRIVFAGLLLALHASSAQAQRSSSWEPGIGFLTGKFHIDDAGADKIETAQDCQSLWVRQNRCKVWEFESSAKRCSSPAVWMCPGSCGPVSSRLRQRSHARKADRCTACLCG